MHIIYQRRWFFNFQFSQDVVPVSLDRPVGNIKTAAYVFWGRAFDDKVDDL